jgi:hypothetical protein
MQAATNAPDKKQESISESFLINRESDPLLRHGDGSKVHPLNINELAFLSKTKNFDAEQLLYGNFQLNA